jgi:hypothetical protein
MDAEMPGDGGSDVFIAKEVDGLVDNGSEDTPELLRIIYINTFIAGYLNPRGC